jgi:hypothetical protein
MTIDNTYILDDGSLSVPNLGRTKTNPEDFSASIFSWYVQGKLTENTKTGEERLELEYEFFRKHGLDIKCCEEQIEIKPGELLIVDNIRAVHGRIGPRNPKEIYQFLFGIERVTPQEIAEFRRYIVNQLSKEISNP